MQKFISLKCKLVYSINIIFLMFYLNAKEISDTSTGGSERWKGIFICLDGVETLKSDAHAHSADSLSLSLDNLRQFKEW